MTTQENLLQPVSGLIEDISDDLLRFAAGEYKRRGRGAVVVCSPHFQSAGDRVVVPFNYLTDCIDLCGDDWPDDEMASMVADYLPEREAIVVWIRRDRSLEYYRLAK